MSNIERPRPPAGKEALDIIEKLGRRIYSDALPFGNDKKSPPTLSLQAAYNRTKETMYRGAEPISPMYCMQDGYQTIQAYNTYRFCITPEGSPILVHFEDIAHAGIGPYKGPDAERINKLLPDAENVHFLQHPEHARVTEARLTRTYEPWVDMTAKICDMDEIDYTIHYGLLYRLSETVWANDWIMYWSKPALEGKGKNKTQKTNENGEPLHQLYYYTSGSKQDDPIDLDAQKFKKRIGDTLSKLGAFKAGAPKTIAEMRRTVRADFHMREKIFREGQDPEAFMLNTEFKKDSSQSKWASRRHASRVLSLRGAQAMNNFVQRIKLEKVKKKGALGFFITGLKLLSKSKRMAIVTSPLFIATLVISSISYLVARKDSLISRDRAHLKHRDDISHDFWGSTAKGLNDMKHYGLLDPVKGSMLRVLKADEACVMPAHNVSFYEGEFNEAGWHAIADTTRSRNGSIVEGYNINGCSHEVVTEPNGMGVDYVPFMDTEFAIPNFDEPLPNGTPPLSTIKKALEANPDKSRPIMKVFKDDKGDLTAEFLDAATFEREVSNLKPSAPETTKTLLSDTSCLSTNAWEKHNELMNPTPPKRGLMKWFKRSCQKKTLSELTAKPPQDTSHLLEEAIKFRKMNERIKYINPHKMPMPSAPAEPPPPENS